VIDVAKGAAVRRLALAISVVALVAAAGVVCLATACSAAPEDPIVGTWTRQIGRGTDPSVTLATDFFPGGSFSTRKIGGTGALMDGWSGDWSLQPDGQTYRFSGVGPHTAHIRNDKLVFDSGLILTKQP
jgi:hypothetical protein